MKIFSSTFFFWEGFSFLFSLSLSLFLFHWLHLCGPVCVRPSVRQPIPPEWVCVCVCVCVCGRASVWVGVWVCVYHLPVLISRTQWSCCLSMTAPLLARSLSPPEGHKREPDFILFLLSLSLFLALFLVIITITISFFPLFFLVSFHPFDCHSPSWLWRWSKRHGDRFSFIYIF